MAPDDLAKAREALRKAHRVAFFTGAGASQESGIDTFRDDGGIWERFPLDEFATVSGLLKTGATSPERFADFIIAVLEPIAQATPNPAHRAMASLEDRKRVSVVTQNVDALHQAAGSDRVYEVHGSLFSVVNPAGQRVRQLSRADLLDIVAQLRAVRHKRMKLLRVLRAVWPILAVTPTGRLLRRPNVVLFGEGLNEPDWTEAQHAVSRADLLVVVGTSGEVFPANQLPEIARLRGAPVVGVGLEPGPFDIYLPGKAAEVLPALLEG